jgi:pimeloyl-ACP methyl ester carboxylesterase
MAKLSKALSNSSFKEVQNCGHIPQEEFPDVTNKLVTDFLNDAS